MMKKELDEIRKGLENGGIVPYLGPGVLELVPNCPVPNSPEVLVERLVAKVSVPHKIRRNLTAAAQFIENFKHRKTLTTIMEEAFRPNVAPTELHGYLADIPQDTVIECILPYRESGTLGNYAHEFVQIIPVKVD